MIKRWYIHGNIVEKDTGDADYTKWRADQDHLTEAHEITEAQYQELIPAVRLEQIRELRAGEFRQRIPITDQLDALLKQFNLMRMNGLNLVDDLDGVIGEWLAVKRKHPIEDTPST